MAKEKRARNSGADQIRAHQEECWRRTALEAGRAVLYLLEAQDGLHGPDWRDQMVRAKDAAFFLKRARRWLREGRSMSNLGALPSVVKGPK